MAKGSWQGHEAELKDLYWGMMQACAETDPQLLPAYVQVLVEEGLATPQEAEQMRQEALRLSGRAPNQEG